MLCKIIYILQMSKFGKGNRMSITEIYFKYVFQIRISNTGFKNLNINY